MMSSIFTVRTIKKDAFRVHERLFVNQSVIIHNPFYLFPIVCRIIGLYTSWRTPSFPYVFLQ